MKNNLTIIMTNLMIACILSVTSVFAQEKASPAKVAQASVNGNDITINYSSPFKKNRAIYGGLVPYGEVWRTGANEATTLELSKDATIGDVSLKAGKYALFTIPGESEWTVIINSDAKQWGAYKYDKSKDVGRFTVQPTALSDVVESFTIGISDAGEVSLSWDQTRVAFTIQ